jgi:penicillin-binding protein 1A
MEEWHQHYPTYNFKNRDIVLAEYEAAATVVESEERLFLNSSNIAVVVATAVGTVVIGSVDDLYENQSLGIEPLASFLGACFFTIMFSSIVLKHFAERQKSILFAKRKLIVLRKMLGLEYGALQLVLPNWRYEGASNPFAVKLFPGWGSYVAYPFWIISLVGSLIFFLLALSFWTHELPDDHLNTSALYPALIAAVIAFLLSAAIFRSSLFDTHETFGLLLIRLLSLTLNLRLVGNWENVIYRAKLAGHEQQRVGVNYKDFKEVLIFLEDREFMKHKGISFRGIGRAIWKYLREQRRTGGPTITQQLARTLFIVDLGRTFRRKFIELLLAVWLERRFHKDRLIELYMASVRFDHGVYGVAAAMRHFDLPHNSDVSDAFFLIERVSNARGRILYARLDELISQAHIADLIKLEDIRKLLSTYEEKSSEGILHSANPERLKILVAKWS